ncbi:MAG TPA: MlaD family protein [Acidimicrobiales bacterium]
MASTIPYRIRVVAGMTGLVLMLAVVTLVVDVSNGALSSGYRLQAVFARAGQGLYPGNDVKVRGVTVGSVTGAHLTPDDTVVIGLHIHPGVRIPVTTSASVQPLSVFGATYVDLVPGADERTGPYLAPGATISRTVPTTGLLDVLNRTYGLLGAVNPQDLSTVISTLGEGLQGAGPELGHTVDSLHAVAAHAVADLPQLQALVAQLADLTRTLGPRGAEIAAISAQLDQVLPEIAGHPDQISALLDDTSQLAGDVSGLLEGHRPAIDAVVNGLSAAVAGLYSARADLPPFEQSLAEFFSFVSGIIRAPGQPIPGGRVAGNIEGYFPANPCVLLAGVCPGSP